MGTLNVADINLSGVMNQFKGAAIASASAIDIGDANGNMVHITGVTTITDFGTPSQSGVRRTLVFEGSLILSHATVNIFLPGAVSVTTDAGDIAEFVYDSAGALGAGWYCTGYLRALIASANVGQLFTNRRYFTTPGPGTYTPTNGVRKAIVRMWGGGGAGGSATAVAGGANGGGGAGAYAEYILTNVSGTYSYTIGSGGSPVAGAAGGNGGDTTFTNGGTTVTAPGGSGGAFLAGSAAIKITTGGAGGVAPTNADFGTTGNAGGNGITSSVVTVGAGGNGGETLLGGSGKGGLHTSAVASAGTAANTSSGSGGGGASTGTTAAALGGAGGNGVIIIEEYR